MPDITMCSNRQCEKRSTCYRYCAVPTPGRQSVAKFMSRDCEHYREITGYDFVQSSRQVDRQIDGWRR